MTDLQKSSYGGSFFACERLRKNGFTDAQIAVSKKINFIIPSILQARFSPTRDLASERIFRSSDFDASKKVAMVVTFLHERNRMEYRSA